MRNLGCIGELLSRASRDNGRLYRAHLPGMLLAVAATWGFPRPASAKVEFRIEYKDLTESGFYDSTPASPVGGNAGTTVGEQRRIALEHALGVYAQALDGTVPIVVATEFKPLPCTEGTLWLGEAKSVGVVAGGSKLQTNIAYPYALANQIEGKDLAPTQADIAATFNSAVGTAACAEFAGWYYGLDHRAGTANDFLAVLLHELAHGLGFACHIDPLVGRLTGARLDGMVDLFASHLFDTRQGKHWDELTPDERKLSAVSPRQVVWDGKYVTLTARQRLAKGVPTLKLTPVPAGFSGFVSQANYGPALTTQSAITGPLTLVSSDLACSASLSRITGIALFRAGACSPLNMSSNAELAGAKAVIIELPNASLPPAGIDISPDSEAQRPIQIPTLGVASGDATALARAAASGLTVTLGAADQSAGTDSSGRVYMYASDPVTSGSTLSHWDPAVSPNLLLEPQFSHDFSGDLSLELALLRDIGWTLTCGNGRLDGPEECDAGDDNGAAKEGGCRLDCTQARCGDNVIDLGEECDNGLLNGNGEFDSCRSTCRNAEKPPAAVSGITGSAGSPVGTGGNTGSSRGGNTGVASTGVAGVGATGRGTSGLNGLSAPPAGAAAGMNAISCGNQCPTGASDTPPPGTDRASDGGCSIGPTSTAGGERKPLLIALLGVLTSAALRRRRRPIPSQ